MRVGYTSSQDVSQQPSDKIGEINDEVSLVEEQKVPLPEVERFVQPVEGTKTQPSQDAQRAKRSEIDVAGRARATQLNQQFSQNVKSAAPQTTNTSRASTNRIYKDGVTNLVEIASSSKYTSTEKEEFFRDYMSASKDNLRNLITGSELWPPELRQHVDAALIGSEKLQERVAQELTPAQQTQVLDRLLGHGFDSAYVAIAKIIEKTNSPDYIASHLKDMKNFHDFPVDTITDPSSGVLYLLARRAKDLSPDSNLTLAKKIIHNQQFDPYLGLADRSSRYQTIDKFFENMSPNQKNLLFDQLQDAGEIPAFAAAIGQDRNVSLSILSGLSDKNVDFLREVFLKLARDADQAGKKDLGNDYENNALQLKGWLQNHFPNYVVK